MSTVFSSYPRRKNTGLILEVKKNMVLIVILEKTGSNFDPDL